MENAHGKRGIGSEKEPGKWAFVKTCENKKMKNPIAEKVDSFIKRIHNSEIIVSERTNTFEFVDETDDTKKSLSEYLADEIHKYEVASVDEPDLKSAIECSRWRNRAFFYGLIKENTENLLTKITQKDEEIQRIGIENKKLTEEMEKCATDLIFIQGKYEELNSKFDRMLPKGSEMAHE